MPKSKVKNKKKSNRIISAIKLNATSIRRSVETFQIDPSLIQVPEWMVGTDSVFVSLYRKYLLGRISGFATRVPLDMITVGFYLPAQNYQYQCDTPPEDLIQATMLEIQQGRRPVLHLYPNSNSSDTARFLCPDDVVVCISYKRLKFRIIPAVVFGSGRQSLPFSSFESKVSAVAKNQGPRICGLVSADIPTQMATILGINLPASPVEGVQKLTIELRTLIARLRLFHVPSSGQLHYHHMIFSAVIRAQETLQAIEILIKNDLWYQALALLRVLYEIHLNFYFDWLLPETNYKFLAAAAVFNTAGVSKQKQEMRQELMEKGFSAHAAEDQANRAWKPVVLASTVSEKARLPKVGILYHKDIYDFLSQISHQNFEVASLHANRFDDDTFLAIDDDLKKTYLRFMDYIISEFALCVDQDIGTVSHD